jgi:hypothetical protein
VKFASQILRLIYKTERTRLWMMMEESNDATSMNSEDLADEILDAVEDDEDDDALTKGEREVEKSKEKERIKKARQLRKQLRKKELGLLRFRWPALILMVAGVLAIISQFQQVMVHPVGIGYDSFIQAFFDFGGLFWLFPFIGGILYIIFGIIGYRDTRGTILSIIPAMLLAMAAMTTYFMITFAVTVNPEAVIYATTTPVSMLITSLLSILAILMRERT